MPLALIKLLHPWGMRVYDPVVKSEVTGHPDVTGAKDLPTNIRSLEQRWEDFVDLLDVYRNVR